MYSSLTTEILAELVCGTGVGRSINGLGFSPDFVLIKNNAANYAVFRISEMAGDITAYLAASTADFTGGITSLDTNGFTIGTSPGTNASGNKYHWQAFGNAYKANTLSGAADFATGVYLGNGIDNSNITATPFQPDLVVSRRSGTTSATFRTSAVPGDSSSYFAAIADSANNLQLLNSDGFQIGTSAYVNTNSSFVWQ